jgi:hypothetical protein
MACLTFSLFSDDLEVWSFSPEETFVLIFFGAFFKDAKGMNGGGPTPASAAVTFLSILEASQETALDINLKRNTKSFDFLFMLSTSPPRTVTIPGKSIMNPLLHTTLHPASIMSLVPGG